MSDTNPDEESDFLESKLLKLPLFLGYLVQKKSGKFKVKLGRNHRFQNEISDVYEQELMKKDTGTNSDLCISQGGKGKQETELGAK